MLQKQGEKLSWQWMFHVQLAVQSCLSGGSLMKIGGMGSVNIGCAKCVVSKSFNIIISIESSCHVQQL